MIIERRSLLHALPVLPIAFAAGSAAAATTDLVLNCDPTLGPVMRAASRRFDAQKGVGVRVFPTPPDLILPQLARAVQNDVIITRQAAMADAVRTGLVAAGEPQGAWRNRFVLVARQGAGAAALNGRVAVTDPTPAADLDGAAVLRKLGLAPPRVLGVIDTDEVVFLVLRGDADAGLVHMTDLRAHAELEQLRDVAADAAPPPVYAITVTKLARRPDPAAFVAFLMSSDGAAIMAANGLEALT